MINLKSNIKNTLDDIPSNKESAKKITKIVKRKNKTIGYEIGDEFYDKKTAIDMAKKGLIQDVAIAHRGQTQYLKSIPDNNEDNNLQ